MRTLSLIKLRKLIESINNHDCTSDYCLYLEDSKFSGIRRDPGLQKVMTL